jgi:hypothetical protein
MPRAELDEQPLKIFAHSAKVLTGRKFLFDSNPDL